MDAVRTPRVNSGVKLLDYVMIRTKCVQVVVEVVGVVQSHQQTQEHLFALLVEVPGLRNQFVKVPTVEEGIAHLSITIPMVMGLGVVVVINRALLQLLSLLLLAEIPVTDQLPPVPVRI